MSGCCARISAWRRAGRTRNEAIKKEHPRDRPGAGPDGAAAHRLRRLQPDPLWHALAHIGIQHLPDLHEIRRNGGQHLRPQRRHPGQHNGIHRRNGRNRAHPHLRAGRIRARGGGACGGRYARQCEKRGRKLYGRVSLRSQHELCRAAQAGAVHRLAARRRYHPDAGQQPVRLCGLAVPAGQKRRNRGDELQNGRNLRPAVLPQLRSAIGQNRHRPAGAQPRHALAQCARQHLQGDHPGRRIAKPARRGGEQLYLHGRRELWRASARSDRLWLGHPRHADAQGRFYEKLQFHLRHAGLPDGR